MTLPRDDATIEVRPRLWSPLMHLTAALLLFAVSVWCGSTDRAPLWVALLAGLASLVYAVLVVPQVLDRKAKLVFRRDGVDVAICRTGLIRYQEIVHVECFRVQQQSAVALFLTAEAQARLPPDAIDGRSPVLASEMFSGPPIWFADGSLDCTAHEIVAEIEARRRGETGPLTARRRAG